MDDLPCLSASQREGRIARGTEDGAQLVEAGDRELPQLSVHDDGVRRFIALVDECYDRKVPLYLEARVPLEALYTEATWPSPSVAPSAGCARCSWHASAATAPASAAPPKQELRMAARAHPPARPSSVAVPAQQRVHVLRRRAALELQQFRGAVGEETVDAGRA